MIFAILLNIVRYTQIGITDFDKIGGFFEIQIDYVVGFLGNFVHDLHKDNGFATSSDSGYDLNEIRIIKWPYFRDVFSLLIIFQILIKNILNNFSKKQLNRSLPLNIFSRFGKIVQ